MDSTLYADAFLEARELTAPRVVVVRRTAQTGTQAEILAAFRDVSAAIRPEHRSWGLVMDMREAVGRNDAEFEQATAAIRKQASERFARTVVLVRTQAGRLQTQRLARDEGRATARVSFDYDEAVSWASPLGASPSS